MIIADDLISRVRGEYREMPGMRLTFAQARRLWHMDTTTCSAVLASLLAEGVLYQCPDGAYAAFPPTPRTPAKATLPAALSDRAAAVRPA